MKLLYLLPLLAISACSTVNSSNDMGTFTDQEVGDVGSNDDNGSETFCRDGVYYVDSITLPTRMDGMRGDTVGFDLDGAATSCGIDDWSDNVDNSFLDFVSASQLEIRRELSESTCLTPSGSLSLDLRITVSGGCSQVAIEHAFSATSPVIFAITERNGAIFANDTGETLVFPVMYDSTDVSLPIVNLSFSAQINRSTMNNIILGGTLLPDDLDTFVEDYVTSSLVNNCPENCSQAILDRYFEVVALLDDHYDLEACGAMSIGLLATASRSEVTERCP